MLPLVVQVEKTSEQKADTVAFKKSPIRIGRNPLNDLQLDEPFVSQWHAVIRFSENRTSYLDLGSTNRTLINGRPIERNVEVTIDQDTDIRIGSLRLHTLRTAAPPELFGRRRSSAFVPESASFNPPTMLLSKETFSRLQKSGGAAPSSSPPGNGRSGDNVSGTRNSIHSLLPFHSQASTSAAPRAARTSDSAPAAGDPLASSYRSYREQWRHVLVGVRQQLESLPPERRDAQASELQRRYPELSGEREFNELLETLGVIRARPAMPELQDWLSRLTGGKLDETRGAFDVAAAMERLGAVLEVFSQAFLELRRSQEQFCREMSIEHYSDGSFLHRTDDPRAVLAYLLKSPKDGNTRLTELSRALADFALHQVGLISATVEGGRKLMTTLAPGSLATAQDPPADSPALQHHRPLAKLWSRSARKLWHRYLANHYDLEESDRFVRELFGREFARRYYAVTGGSGSGS